MIILLYEDLILQCFVQLIGKQIISLLVLVDTRKCKICASDFATDMRYKSQVWWKICRSSWTLFVLWVRLVSQLSAQAQSTSQVLLTACCICLSASGIWSATGKHGVRWGLALDLRSPEDRIMSRGKWNLGFAQNCGANNWKVIWSQLRWWGWAYLWNLYVCCFLCYFTASISPITAFILNRKFLKVGSIGALMLRSILC